MNRRVTPSTQALAQRLRVVGETLLEVTLPRPHADPLHECARLMHLLVRLARADPTPDRVWLMHVAIAGRLPTTTEVEALLRRIDLSMTDEEAGRWLLDLCLGTTSVHAAARSLRVMTNEVVVEVDHTARHDLHTGIQQVIRRTMPSWARDHAAVFTAWTSHDPALRPLTTAERRRVLEWADALSGHQPAGGPAYPNDDLTIVVPWRCVVVLPDVSAPEALDPLAALARFSGNRVVSIGYDCIPVVSADLVPVGGASRFAAYLGAVKHMRRVAAISSSAAVEFQGFVDTLPAQGLPGPIVVECELPAEAAGPSSDSWVTGPADPVVLVVGSFEPRKNHLAVLHAAETLWRAGLRFELLMIGGMSWGRAIREQVRRLRAIGRPVTMRQGASQESLDRAYASARFTVFASVHEGYGLPVAESMAAGVPVITGNFGSTAEIASGGGALVVDPRDDLALTSAIRQLLTDDALLATLRAQIERRTVRSWSDYAADLWSMLVTPELRSLEEEQLAAPEPVA